MLSENIGNLKAMNDREEADLIKKRGIFWEQFDDQKSLVEETQKSKKKSNDWNNRQHEIQRQKEIQKGREHCNMKIIE